MFTTYTRSAVDAENPHILRLHNPTFLFSVGVHSPIVLRVVTLPNISLVNINNTAIRLFSLILAFILYIRCAWPVATGLSLIKSEKPNEVDMFFDNSDPVSKCMR